METKHFDLATSYDRNRIETLMQYLAKEIGKKTNHQVRLIEQGGGFAILPDTNCKEDIGEKEFAKAFHLGEIPTATAPKPERITTIFIYDIRRNVTLYFQGVTFLYCQIQLYYIK